MNRRVLKLRYVLALAFCVVGCGDAGSAGSPKLVPVKGRVVYNGKPVAGATVAFHAENAPRPAAGTTDADGRFELTMFNTGDGAMIGDNVVTIAKGGDPATGSSSTDGQSALEMYDKMYKKQQAGEDPNKGEIPEKYRNLKDSPQKNHVTAQGPNDFTIELKD